MRLTPAQRRILSEASNAYPSFARFTDGRRFRAIDTLIAEGELTSVRCSDPAVRVVTGRSCTTSRKHLTRDEPLKSHAGYFTQGFDQHELIAEAEETAAECEDFRNVDTLIGTGLSGAVAVPLLAYALDKTFALVRRDSNESTHDGGMVRGNIGATWAFVDDFVSSGETRDRVREEVDQLLARKNALSTYVGAYQYTNIHRWRPHHD